MFGYAAFAQSSYATLGTSAYSVAVLEVFSAGDVETVITAFKSVILENLTNADISLCGSVYPVLITESQSFGDLSLSGYIYNASSTENINLLAAPAGFAWVKIDNTESTTWVLIDNRQ